VQPATCGEKELNKIAQLFWCELYEMKDLPKKETGTIRVVVYLVKTLAALVWPSATLPATCGGEEYNKSVYSG